VASAADTVDASEVAAAYVPSLALLAVTEQTPWPEVMVTVVPETEQILLVLKVTAPVPLPPEELTVKVLP
jgi:hypothetical protein